MLLETALTLLPFGNESPLPHQYILLNSYNVVERNLIMFDRQSEESEVAVCHNNRPLYFVPDDILRRFFWKSGSWLSIAVSRNIFEVFGSLQESYDRAFRDRRNAWRSCT